MSDEHEQSKPTMTAADELAAVMGGTDVDLIYKDGKTETLKVRELGADEIPRYAAIIDDESRCAELFCSKSQGWAKTLTTESFNKVMDTGQELNLPLFGAWFRRSMARRELTTPGISKVLEETFRKLIESNFHSPVSSSPSPSATTSQ